MISTLVISMRVLADRLIASWLPRLSESEFLLLSFSYLSIKKDPSLQLQLTAGGKGKDKWRSAIADGEVLERGIGTAHNSMTLLRILVAKIPLPDAFQRRVKPTLPYTVIILVDFTSRIDLVVR